MSEHRYFDCDECFISSRSYTYTGITYEYTRYPWRLVVECEVPVGAYFEAFA